MAGVLHFVTSAVQPPRSGRMGGRPAVTAGTAAFWRHSTAYVSILESDLNNDLQKYKPAMRGKALT